jgi:PAS domain S-box-containing protein
MPDSKPTYEELQKRVAQLELRLRQIESRDYFVKENDAELEALKVDYEVVFRNTNFYVAFYRPDGEIVAYNEIAAREVGYKPDQLVGKSVWDVFDKEQADIFYQRMQKALNERKLIKYEELNETKQGKSWFEVDYIPVINEDDEIIGCQVIAKDIGEKKTAIQSLNDVQKALLKSQGDYKLLIDNQLDGVAISNKDEVFEFANPAAEQIFGVSEGELMGKSLNVFLDESQKQLVKEQTNKRSKGESSGYELDIIKQDGAKVNLFVHAIPNVNGEGEVIGTLAFFRDITANKKAERELENSHNQYRTILENTSEGVFVAKDGFVLFANNAVEKFTGYRYSDNHRLSFYEIVHPDDRALVKQNYEKRLTGATIPAYDVRILTNEGEYRWAIINAVKIEWEGEPADLVFAQDIHERKMAELELGEKTRELEELNKTKNRLLSIFGHDLRNPINNIKGFIFLLEKRLGIHSDEKIKKYIDAIYQSSTTLSELLENLLVWSKSQTQELTIQPQVVDVFEIIETNVRHFIHNANFKSIKVTNNVDKEVTVYADKSMLNTIIRNLLSNAIKFSYEGSEIIINAAKSRNLLKISVQDFGVGIEQDKADRMFKLIDLESTKGTAGEEGTGLGLTICKEFVERHGGKIWMESNIGKGATFYFTLPLE